MVAVAAPGEGADGGGVVRERDGGLIVAPPDGNTALFLAESEVGLIKAPGELARAAAGCKVAQLCGFFVGHPEGYAVVAGDCELLAIGGEGERSDRRFVIEDMGLGVAAADQGHAVASGYAGEIAGFRGVGEGCDRAIERFGKRRALAA